jgi:hypothetical protein
VVTFQHTLIFNMKFLETQNFDPHKKDALVRLLSDIGLIFLNISIRFQNTATLANPYDPKSAIFDILNLSYKLL